MILVDTSVWIDHFRKSEPILADLAAKLRLATHSVVIGELACGSLRDRHRVLADLKRLPRAPEIGLDSVLDLLDRHALWGLGLSWPDACLLVACVDSGMRVWTRDKALRVAAGRLGVLAALD